MSNPSCLIPLSQGQFAIVDEGDYGFLSQFKWHAQYVPKMGKFYATRYQSIKMHRQLMDILGRSDVMVDHINGNTLDNRRSNLRIVTAQQNTFNRAAPRGSRVPLKGVSKRYGRKSRPTPNCYRAQIMVNGNKHHLGVFPTPELAHAAYVKASLEMHGVFSRFNKEMAA